MFIKPNLQKKLVLCLLLLFSGNLFAQNTIHNAWQAFFNNQADSAKTFFNQAIQQNDHAADALLGLSLLAQTDQSPVAAFGYFQKFYAQSKNPDPYVYALWTTTSITGYSGKHTPDQLAFLNKVASSDSSDGMMAAMAHSIIGKHYETGNQYDKADAEYKKISSLDNWQITGEFENISTSGFDRTYPVIDHPEADAQFTIRNGAKAGWHNVTDIRNDKWFDFEYYANAENSVIFSQSFVKADAETLAQLRIGVSGSVKVWVNDQLILSVPEERNNDLDSYIQTIKLNKGYNRILLQIGESYAGNMNFLLRITDSKGIPLTNLTSVAQAQPYTKETAFASQKIEPFAIPYFENEIKAHPDDCLPKILLAEAYLRNDKTFEARRLIEELRSQYPDNTFLNLMLLEVFNREDNRTGAETIEESIKKSDPQSTEGLILKFNELYEQKDYDKAADIIKQLEAKNTEQQEFIYEAKIRLADANKNQDEIVRLGDEAYTKFPDDKDVAELKYNIEKELRKNPNAIDILKKWSAPDQELYDFAQEIYREKRSIASHCLHLMTAPV